ncbi:hypothetical protein F5141DRAFT_1067515 [Pisolithus sp. B1]|nr:hypothetical protein F5141DRAFT_1067515 [Pisolithus sp. B1]
MLDCPVIGVGWYKKQNGVEHEFLWFDISSPDNMHTAIVIAQEGHQYSQSERATQATSTITSSAIPTHSVGPETLAEVASDSTASSADKGSPHVDKATKSKGKTKLKTRRPLRISYISNSLEWNADDSVNFATLDSAAGDVLKQKCEDATCICTLTFSEKAQPSTNQLVTLLDVTSKHEPTYTITNMQCYWFVETVFEALKSLFDGAEQDIPKHRRGTWNGVPVHTKKESMNKVCDKYCAARAALTKEAEQKHRAE